jgi:signal transduction histidine kinase
LNELISSCVQQHQEFAFRKEINIYLRLHDEIIVQADINMINSVVRNLLNNALKFTMKYGSIYITSKIIKEHVIIYFSDTGIGIPEDSLYKIFQNNNYTTTGTKGERGTGLGLQICKHFLTRNKGNLYINSQPGIGTDACFSLPKKERK